MNPIKAIRDMRTIGRLLGDAERIARATGDERPAAEHLLLAAIDLPDGTASRAFATLGVGRGEVEASIAEVHRSGLVAAGVDEATAGRMVETDSLEPATPAGVYRSAESAQELFQAAGALARQARQRFMGAHVLVAASRLERGTAVRALDLLGVDREALERAALEELEAA